MIYAINQEFPNTQKSEKNKSPAQLLFPNSSLIELYISIRVLDLILKQTTFS